MSAAVDAETAGALLAVREELRLRLHELHPHGRLGEHVAPAVPIEGPALLALCRTTATLLAQLGGVQHADLHNAAWLLLLHLRDHMRAAGLPVCDALEALLAAKAPRR